LADAILTYSAAHHRDTLNIKSRLSKVLADFGGVVNTGLRIAAN
jgi:hypothetical protein